MLHTDRCNSNSLHCVCGTHHTHTHGVKLCRAPASPVRQESSPEIFLYSAEQLTNLDVTLKLDITFRIAKVGGRASFPHLLPHFS